MQYKEKLSKIEEASSIASDAAWIVKKAEDDPRIPSDIIDTAIAEAVGRVAAHEAERINGRS